MPTWLSKLILVASILTAIVSPLAGINPKYGIAATLIAGLVNAFADGFVHFVLPKRVTVAGILLVISAALAYLGSQDPANIFGLLSAHTLAIIAQIGVIAATIGKKLQESEGGDSGGGTGGFTPSNGLTGRLIVCLLGSSALTSGCHWKKSERPLVSAGYNFQIGILATAKVTAAVRMYKPGSLSPEKAHSFLSSLQKTSQVGQGFSLAIDQTIEINPQTKSQLLGEADRYLAQIDATVAILDPSQTTIREWLLVVRAAASAFKVAIAAIEVPTPTVKVKAAAEKALKQSSKAAGSRDINDTVNLINALGGISADFTADVLAQKGLDAAALRVQRDVKYQAVQAFIATELAR